VARSAWCKQGSSFRETYSRGVVEVEMALLDTLAVDTLRVGQTEETFLEERTGSCVRRWKW
jgi:hypothetical protein